MAHEFVIDEQTLEDLNIFRKKGGVAVYNLYNRTITRGGATALKNMFRQPLSDAGRINSRSRIIKYFFSMRTAFPLDEKLLEQLESYLSGDNRGKKSHSDVVKRTERGVLAAGRLIREACEFLDSLHAGPVLEDFHQEMGSIRELANHAKLNELVGRSHRRRKPNFDELADYDYLLRFEERDRIAGLLEQLYQVDAYIAVATAARDLGLSFPNVRSEPDGGVLLKLKNLRHPTLAGAVGNDVLFSKDTNMMFLTGANMAGKSTFMKALGLAVYLAHLGFPVTANEMECTLRDGLVTTINLSDSLNLGFSHFYTEVHRVKQVAHHLAAGKHLFVIFDELFRGTNVKDAYEATVAVTKAFARHPSCIFVISTHIIEAAGELKPACTNISFSYLPAEIRGQTLHYTYKLMPGITEDRHGMMIIKKERILEILSDSKHLGRRPAAF